MLSVLATLFLLGPLLAHFPTAALGGIVVYAAVRPIDVAGFRRLAAFRRSELLLALAALGGALILDLLYGVLLAVALSVTELLARIARPHDAFLGIVPGLAGLHDVDHRPDLLHVELPAGNGVGEPHAVAPSTPVSPWACRRVVAR